MSPIELSPRFKLWDWITVVDAPGPRDLIGRRGTIEQVLMVISDEERSVRHYVNTGCGRRYLDESNVGAT